MSGTQAKPPTPLSPFESKTTSTHDTAPLYQLGQTSCAVLDIDNLHLLDCLAPGGVAMVPVDPMKLPNLSHLEKSRYHIVLVSWVNSETQESGMIYLGLTESRTKQSGHSHFMDLPTGGGPYQY
jgi:hypothetical protein